MSSRIEGLQIKGLAATLTEDLVLDHSPVKTQKTSGIIGEGKTQAQSHLRAH